MGRKSRSTRSRRTTSRRSSVVKDIGAAAVDSVPGGRVARAAYGLVRGRMGTKKGKPSGLRGKNARSMLKKAYERKARFFIRTGQLGKARKTLIKKRSF